MYWWRLYVSYRKEDNDTGDMASSSYVGNRFHSSGFSAIQYRAPMSYEYNLVIWGASIVSHTLLLSFEYVLVLWKRYTTAKLYTLRHNDSALVQLSPRMLKFACQTNVFVAIALLI